MTAASGRFVGRQSQLALLERDLEEVGRSTVPAADLVRSGTSFGSWEAALSTVALSTGDRAIVIVIDELPYLSQKSEFDLH